MIYIDVVEGKLSTESCLSKVRDNTAGAISTFVGSVRRISNEKTVIRLEYECRKSMAIKEMKRIAEEVSLKYSLIHTCIIHRIGTLGVGEDAVVIAVSAKHRKDSIAACSTIIEMLKKTVPIWKKEVFEDGEEWVSNTP